ncbi:uncharacterized protein K452DRAFT_143348 [Aplosporella prunicola CBS 121167]|uniref:Uncharacterized protein n=1 Tax=Aplosporella prunicola CBS 121167 TaxID=1176127 RepID=A0A6A6BPP1_9PEZI|nr:uncharacterized protein K452DRAFT_143348 [Aplosporella prunicola CBS 121167]KAF2144531.1 hypothetical protein K452DRAFT_143348 [Aplosporella prunicola CBS 121167]
MKAIPLLLMWENSVDAISGKFSHDIFCFGKLYFNKINKRLPGEMVSRDVVAVLFWVRFPGQPVTYLLLLAERRVLVFFFLP